MIVASNTATQTLDPGQSITFNNPILVTRGAEGYCCPNGFSSRVRLRANGIFEIHFDGNVTGSTATTPVQLNIALGGVPLPETTMIYTPASENAIGAVSATTAVRNCCNETDLVTVTNTGTEPIIVSENSSLYIRRIA